MVFTGHPRSRGSLAENLARMERTRPLEESGSKTSREVVSSEPRGPAALNREAERWWRPFGRAGDASVVYVDLAPHPAREAAALGWLDREERSRWNRFRRQERRRQQALCRAALRAVLCARLGCANDTLSFRESERGKPLARLSGAPAPVSFSVSHSGGHGLLAIAREGRIGVDVEERIPRRDLDGLMAAVLTPDERLELAAVSGHHRTASFFTLWTIKEALLKALGTGLEFDMAGFEAPPAMRRGVTIGELRFPHLPAVTWRVENLGNEQFAAAVAHERGPGPAAAGRGETASVDR